MGSGCYCHPSKPQPNHPGQVRGWESYQTSSITILGEFVLKKGESTNNGKIGIMIVDITPPKACANPNEWLGSPKVTYRFYNISDNHTFCETTTLDGGGGMGSECADRVPGVTAVYTYAINTKDNWVHFDIR